jgi:2-keto-4-pentenoate hydratase
MNRLPVNPDRVEQISQLIASGRRHMRSVPPLSSSLRPQWEEMYPVHDRVNELLGLHEVGWKVGAAAREIQIAEGLPDALAGRIYRTGLHDSAALLDPDLFINYRLCESEFVLTLGEDLRAGEDPLDVAEVAQAVATVRPGLEVGDMVFPDWYESSKFWGSCLDNAGGSQLVLGEESPYESGMRLDGHRIVLSSNGEPVKEGFGAAAMGDPIISATWVVNLRRRAGDQLRAGTLLSTGTCTGHYFAKRGEIVAADFGSLGTAIASFL